MESLSEALKTYGTSQLLADRVELKTGDVQWRSYVGTADKFFFGLIKFGDADDVLWPTALSVDALVTIWARRSSSSCGWSWLPETPQIVKETVADGLVFLLKYGIPGVGEYKNAAEALFFTADFKGKTLFPIKFPGDFARWRNGTDYSRSIYAAIPDELLGETLEQLVYGVDGAIDDRIYQLMKTKSYFGRPSSWDRINLATEPYMMWTAKSLTYSMTPLAILRASHVC